MRGSTLVFHGDRQDLESLFAEWFGTGDLLVSEDFSRLNAELEQGTDLEFVMGRLLKPGALSSPAMVLAPAGSQLAVRSVVMADGSGTKKELDISNRFVVGIRFGGQTAEAVLQPTVLTTSGDDDQAKALFQRLKKTVVNRGKRVRDCIVLPGAYEKLMQGWRLPSGQFQAPVTDLPRPAE